MASVNDYGGPTNSLAAVPLGGVGGWAEAVAAALDNSDVSVDSRISATRWTGTLAQYQALGTYDPDVLYVVVG